MQAQEAYSMHYTGHWSIYITQALFTLHRAGLLAMTAVNFSVSSTKLPTHGKPHYHIVMKKNCNGVYVLQLYCTEIKKNKKQTTNDKHLTTMSATCT